MLNRFRFLFIDILLKAEYGIKKVRLRNRYFLKLMAMKPGYVPRMTPPLRTKPKKATNLYFYCI